MKPERILIIQLKRAGDVLLTTPIATALKQTFPAASIDFLVDSAFVDVIKGLQAIDNILPYDIRKPFSVLSHLLGTRYDWVFDFQRSARSAIAAFLSGAKIRAGYQMPFWGHLYTQSLQRPGQGIQVTQGKRSLVESVTGTPLMVSEPLLELDATEKAWASSVLPSTQSMVVGIIPTHRHAIRRWPAESFAAVAREWLSKHAEVWVFWGPGEEAIAEEVLRLAPGARLAPATTFRQMAALLSRCKVVITNDSGPMHVAAAVGVPTVTVYGPTDPAVWNPGGPRHRALRMAQLACIGCNRLECPYNHECMKDLPASPVYQASQALLAELPRL